MEVTASVVGEEDVDCFAAWVGCVFCAFDRVVDGVYDVGVGGEKGVGLYFFEGEGDRFLTEGAADLFEGVELGCRGFLYKIDVGESALVMR